jgi:hypothetical protein
MSKVNATIKIPIMLAVQCMMLIDVVFFILF